MGKCVACPSRSEEKSKCSFHRFPKKNATLRAKWVNWVRSVKNLKWTPKTASRLCSEHFPANCFEDAANRTGLLRCAVPSLLDGQEIVPRPLSPVEVQEYVSKHGSETHFMKEDQEQLPPPAQDQLQCMESEDRCTTPPFLKCQNDLDHQRASILNDHRYEDSPSTSRRKNKQLRERVTKLTKIAKTQKQMIGRMRKKVLSLKELVSTLKNDRHISKDGAHCLDHFSEDD